MQIELNDHLSAWNWEGRRLPRSPQITPIELLEAGLRDFPSKPLIHTDIGTGRGQKLNEIQALGRASSALGEIISWGSEIFLYSHAEYSRGEPRIVTPKELSRNVIRGT